MVLFDYGVQVLVRTILIEMIGLPSEKWSSLKYGF